MTKRPTPNLTPLVDDASQSPFMRELLEAGRDSSVAGYDFEHGLSKHLALVEAGAPLPHWAEGLRPATGAGGAGAAAAGSSLIAWLAVPVALVALTSAVVLVSKQTRAPSTPAQVATQGAPAVAPSASVAVQPAEPVVAPAVALQPSRTPVTNVAPRAARAKRHAPAGKPMPAPVAMSNGASAKSAASSSSGELFATAQPVVAPAQPSTSAPAQSPAKPEQAARPAAPEQPAPQDEARLEREMSMLAVAQRALQADPARSLNLARQGEAEFAGSMFTQERQQVLLLALVKLGRIDEARRLAKPYLARYPHGPFSDRVRHALATGRVER